MAARTLVAGLALLSALTSCALPAAERADRTPAVPVEFRGFFQVAASRCPSVLTPAGLAAQAQVESDFEPDAESPKGAQGLMQIVPATWARYGRDADGNGRADPFTAADSIATSAAISCDLHRDLADVPGDRLALRLAGYNAGPEAVRRYGGVPPFDETRDYIRRVRDYTERFRSQLG